MAVAYAVHVTVSTQIDFNGGTFNFTEYDGEVLKLVDLNDHSRSLCPNQNESCYLVHERDENLVNMSGNILLAYFNETSGQILDYSGNSHNGTTTADTEYLSDGALGGYGANFSSSLDDEIDFGVLNDGVGFDDMEDLTVSFLFKFNSREDNINFLSNYQSYRNQGSFTFEIDKVSAKYYLKFKVYDDKNQASSAIWRSVTSESLGGTTEWYHVVGKMDSSQGKIFLYLNGVQQGNETFTANGLNDSYKFGLTLGGIINNNTGSIAKEINSHIDELAIWNRSLSEQEILAIYNAQGGGFYPGLLGSGLYQSTVLDAGEEVDWQSVIWFEDNVCASCELPNYSRSEESYYFTEGIDMNGTLLLYHLDESSTNTLGNGLDSYDASGNFYHGSVDTGISNNNPSYGQSGIFGNSVKFDNNNDLLEVGYINFSGIKEFTISTWFKSYTTTSRAERRIISCDHTSTSSTYSSCFVFYLDSNDEPVLKVYDSIGNQWTTTNDAAAELTNEGVDTATWRNLVGVFDSTNQKMEVYVDGQLVANHSLTPNFEVKDSGYDLGIGSYQSSHELYGYLDELVILGRALNSTEIGYMYNRSLYDFDTSLKVRTCNDAICSGESFTDFGISKSPLDISSLADNRYVQFLMNLTSRTKPSNLPLGKGIGPSVTYINITTDSDDSLINNTPGTPWNSEGSREPSERALTQVNLSSLTNFSSTTNRTPKLIWNNSITSIDGLIPEYSLQIATDSAFTNIVYTASGITKTNETQTEHVVTSDLHFGVSYWRVMAETQGFESEWSDYWQFDVLTYAAISLPVNYTNFSSLAPGQSKNTTEVGLNPLVISNDGNTAVNISVNATDFFTGESPTYQFQIEANESGAYESAILIWQNLNSTLQQAITYLYHENGTNTANTARLHLLIGVPLNEESGLKNSTIEVTAE